MKKNCEMCKLLFIKPDKGCSNATWEKRRFCSFQCRVKAQTGRERVIKIIVFCKKCRKPFRRSQTLIESRKVKYCSMLCRNGTPYERTPDIRKKISSSLFKIAFKGSNHPRWIPDRSKLVKSEKKHLDGKYRGWMYQVKNRDGWKCKISNQDCSGRLEAHHILNWAEYPELRYQVNNGITLCHSHHPRGREKEKRLVFEFQELVSVSKV